MKASSLTASLIKKPIKGNQSQKSSNTVSLPSPTPKEISISCVPAEPRPPPPHAVGFVSKKGRMRRVCLL